jgi:hypothetical protein
VISTEHSQETRRNWSGFHATLRVFLRAPGGRTSPKYPVAGRQSSTDAVSWSSAPVSCAVWRLGIALLAAVALMLLTVGTAAADTESPPSIGPYCGGSTHTSIALSSVISTMNEVKPSTHWSFSYSEAKGGPWTPVPGGEGTLNGEIGEVKAELTGLTPEVTYYVLLTATNKAGTSTQEAFGGGSGKLEGCETLALRPSASIERFRAVNSSSAHALGEVDPRDSETHWRFEIATNEAGPWAAVPDAEGTISQAEAEALPIYYNAHFNGELAGLKGGTVYYVRLFAESEPLPGVHKQATSEVLSFETAGPPVAKTFAAHAFKGEALRLLGYVETNVEEGGYEAHYHFEYVDQRHFEAEGGFASAETKSTPEEGAGGGAAAADLPQLVAGETYRYRLTATNTTPGNPVVHGEERTLVVPSVPAAGAEASCPNEDFRVGPSADLPDCRAYEQVTPVDKEGSEEAFHYGVFNIANAGALVGEDGDHFEFDGQFVHWGSSDSPYFFSRTEHGWKMTAATPPEAGIESHYLPELDNPDLTQFAFSAAWDNGASASSNIEFKAGLPGGPDQTAVSVPRTQIANGESEAFQSGWVAASEDFSNLILETEDRAVVPGHRTGTASGSDLYEYTQGQFRQLNVAGDAPGVTIGSCGAEIAAGAGEKEFSTVGTATRHSVSADGGRVFFYAVPSGNCPGSHRLYMESRHLYMRTGGVETTDLGTDELLGANAAGTEALLVAHSGETEEVLIYSTESHTSTVLFAMGSEEVRPWLGTGQAPGFAVSEDLGTIYIATGQHLTPEAPPAVHTEGAYLYRYDVSAKALHFVLPGAHVRYLSPDGRYVYFNGEVPGLGEHTYRYDSVENVIECIPCASTFDTEPKHEGEFINYESNSETRDAMPNETVASADGDYVFFDTLSALVPKDVNGEILPNGNSGAGGEFANYTFSPSSDVYEWRKPGVDGCAHVQGCVSLISSGGSGRLVMLLGTTDSGRDVFFTSAAELGPNDNDNAIDVYDARIDGGEPPAPARPVECEGDACSTPAGPPNDATPSSFAFMGAGDIPQAPSSKPVSKTKPKKVKRKPKKVKQRHGKRKVSRAVKGHGKVTRSSRRSG